MEERGKEEEETKRLRNITLGALVAATTGSMMLLNAALKESPRKELVEKVTDAYLRNAPGSSKVIQALTRKFNFIPSARVLEVAVSSMDFDVVNLALRKSNKKVSHIIIPFIFKHQLCNKEMLQLLDRDEFKIFFFRIAIAKDEKYKKIVPKNEYLYDCFKEAGLLVPQFDYLKLKDERYNIRIGLALLKKIYKSLSVREIFMYFHKKHINDPRLFYLFVKDNLNEDGFIRIVSSLYGFDRSRCWLMPYLKSIQYKFPEVLKVFFDKLKLSEDHDYSNNIFFPDLTAMYFKRRLLEKVFQTITRENIGAILSQYEKGGLGRVVC